MTSENSILVEHAGYSDENGDSSARERGITIAALAIVAVFTLLDLIEDRAEGAELGHLVTEGIVVLVAVVGATYLWRRMLKQFRGRHQALHRNFLEAREDAQRWREETSSILKGLGQAIEQQFDAWHLTSAEKEVGIMLLKGLSHKEIAAIRNTSEKTVRQQSASLYGKAQLDGRAQLSAFFLEDLLLPIKA